MRHVNEPLTENSLTICQPAQGLSLGLTCRKCEHILLREFSAVDFPDVILGNQLANPPKNSPREILRASFSIAIVATDVKVG
jgi:hypothetical protein